MTQVSFTQMRDTLGRNREYLLKLAFMLVPVAVFFLLMVRFAYRARGIPDLDYWSMLPSLLSPDGWNFTLETLYRKSNEHIVALTKGFYLLNYAVTRGDNFGLSVLVGCFSITVAMIFATFIAKSSRSLAESIALGLVIAALSFSPMAAHNYLIGMSGVAWIGANLFMVCAAASVACAQARNSIRWYGLGLFFAFLASQSYSTGLMATCAIAVQCLLVPKSRRIGVLLAVLGIGYLLLVFALQDVPQGHSERSFNPVHLTTFALTFLGGGLTTSKALALTWGAAGIVAFLILFWRYVRSAPQHEPGGAFWIAVAAYSLMNSAIAAIGRAGMGGDAAALASRYASIPALFWMGLVGLTLHLARREASAGPSAAHMRGIVFLSVVGALTLLVNGTPRIGPLIERAKGKNLVALSVWLDMKDPKTVTRHVTSVPNQLYSALPGLRAIGHVPFDGRFSSCPKLGAKLGETVVDAGQSLVGYVDNAVPVSGGWYRVRGWALDRAAKTPPLLDRNLIHHYRCVALVDESGVVIGLALGGEARPDVARSYNKSRVEFGWTGYARATKPVGKSRETTRLHALVQDAASGHWVRLHKTVEIGG